MTTGPADLVQSVLETAASKGPGAEPVELTLERSTKYVRHLRKNMEHGVHMMVAPVTTSEGPRFYGYPNATDDDDDVAGAEDDTDSVLLDASKAVTTSAGPDVYGYSNATDDDDDVIGAEDDSDSVLLNAPKAEESAVVTTEPPQFDDYPNATDDDEDYATGSEDGSGHLAKRVMLLNTQKDAPKAKQRRRALSLLDTPEES